MADRDDNDNDYYYLDDDDNVGRDANLGASLPADLEDLLGAYALDAIDHDERELIERYLATDPRARAEVQQYREVLALLPAGGPAPVGVWDRIAEQLAPSPPPMRLAVFDPPIATAVVPIGTRSFRQRGRVLAVAAVTIAIAGLTLALLQQRQKVHDTQRELALPALEREFAQASVDAQSRGFSASNASASIRVEMLLRADGTMFIDSSSLPRLQGDRTYQLWCVRDASPMPVSLGLLGSAPSLSKVQSGSCTGVLAITDEPAGGVSAPTSTPVVSAHTI